MNIFVIASEKTAARSKQIAALVEDIRQEIPCKVEYITEHEPDAALQAEFVKQYVNKDALEAPLEKYNKCSRPLLPPHISNLQKHLSALQKAASSQKMSLVLEDDVIHAENYLVRLKKCMGEDTAPRGWDIIMLGLPGTSEGFHKLCDAYPLLPVCDSYIVTPAGAQKIADAYTPVKFVTNFQLSFAIEKSEAKAYMITPNVFLDSSKYGVYASTVSPNNPLILNRQYAEARMLLSDNDNFLINKDKIYEILTTNQFKNHPDFMHLRALYERKINGPKAAELVFSTALKVYDNCNALLTNESGFLKDYISLFSDLQK